MRTDHLMTRNVHTCSKDDSLADAARVMWEADVGCLVVTEPEGRAIGMITDRDLAMAGYIQGVALRDASVGSAMSSGVHSCAPETPINEVEQEMDRERIRRVPVIDGDGKLVGILTLGDLARSAQSSPLRIAAIPGVTRTLASVCTPRQLHPTAAP